MMNRNEFLRRTALLPALPGALAASLRAQNPAATAARPNVLFILADDLGYGDLGCYGQKRIQTPNLDTLAREGMRFTDFYAGAPVCAPSRCVLMTGLHTGHAQIRGNAAVALRPQDRTVAEVFHAAGYRTGLIGKWGLGRERTTGIPTRQGFDSFFGYLDQTHAHNYYPTFLLRDEKRVPLPNVVPEEGRVGQGVATEKRAYSHDLFIAEALRFVDDNQSRPFFLYLALTIPHANNEARQKGMEVPDYGPYKNENWPEPEKGYAAMVTRMDEGVGRLMERLALRGLDKNTLVIFSSDNGPHREGGNDPDFFDSNGPLRGIKRDLYEGGIRVPTIARWPGHVPAGTVSNHPAYFADFLPTVTELIGAPTPSNLDGISFLPTLRGQETRQRQHDFLYWEFYERGSSQAVRMDRWKGVRRPLNQSDAPIELYDLREDLGETTDVASKHPDIVARVRERMAAAHTPSPLWKVTAPAAATSTPAE